MADNAYHLTEALWISAAPPTGAEIRFIGRGGGGGPGGGGWGLSEGYPRGTSPSKSDIAQVISLRKVLSEEYIVIEKDYLEKYSQELKSLTDIISKIKSQIKAESANSSALPLNTLAEQKNLVSHIAQIRAEYENTLPEANSYFGAPIFYKRGDSVMSRFLEKDFSGDISGEELLKKWVTSLNDSWNGSYRLHIEALKHQALADTLQVLAEQADAEELNLESPDLKTIIERRTSLLHAERQIHFNCLPNVIQHELAKTTIDAALPLAQALSAYQSAAIMLTHEKHSQIPPYTSPNPSINSPLSKPQLEGLLHLVDEQRLQRAGPLWKEYHQALSLIESIRFLNTYKNSIQNLIDRATKIEELQKELAKQSETARQKAEVERLAAEAEQQRQAEAERLAAEAEQQRQAEAERLAAEAEQQRQDALRLKISYIDNSKIATSTPRIVPIGAATFAISEAAYLAMSEAISSAVTSLISATFPSLAVGTLSMLWPSTLGNGERRYLISVPVSNLIPADRSDLVQQIQPSTNINLPYWMAGIENEDDLDLYVVPGSGPIAIREAAFDSERQLYSLALENPQRILTWTPATAPGTEIGNLTPLPSEPSTVVIYEGASLTPTDSLKNYYPGHEAIDQDRLIVTFPTDSGLPPILVVFRSPRYEPGTAYGQGTAITEPWRAATSSINGAPIPDRIAEALRGMEFKTFDAFRKRFWKTIANDVEFSEFFSEDDLFRMKKEGYAPRVDFIDSYKRHATLVLHHLLPINEGGGVYDIDNIRVVTPAVHHAIHYGVKQ